MIAIELTSSRRSPSHRAAGRCELLRQARCAQYRRDGTAVLPRGCVCWAAVHRQSGWRLPGQCRGPGRPDSSEHSSGAQPGVAYCVLDVPVAQGGAKDRRPSLASSWPTGFCQHAHSRQGPCTALSRSRSCGSVHICVARLQHSNGGCASWPAFEALLSGVQLAVF